MPNQYVTATSSLQYLLDGEVIFASDGSWLHPLFDLEEYLDSVDIDSRSAEIRDKIIGKAAAFLILRIGAARVHGHIMSRLAVDVFETNGMPFTHDKLVDRIDCKTEELLHDVRDAEEAYRILRARAGR